MNRRDEMQRDGWIDISQSLLPGISVWPGDPEFTSGWSSSIAEGDACNVGRVSLGLHTGTHAESPLHFEPGGQDIARVPLGVFLGPALVVSTGGRSTLDLPYVQSLESLPERLLLKTDSAVLEGSREAASGLDLEAAQELARRGVRLLGIDTPSVDRAQNIIWPAHRVLARSGVVVLENLVLLNVVPGWYELVALPLKLPGMEASPVRAALRPLTAGTGS